MIRPRSAWAARPPSRPLTLFAPGAVVGVTVHCAGNWVTGQSTPELLRGIQRHHQAVMGWRDIAYNLAVDQAGEIWECRGLDYRNGAHDNALANNGTVAVLALIGQSADGRRVQQASPAMLEGLRRAVAVVTEHHGRSAVYPHSYWTATACPGDQLRAAVAAGELAPTDKDDEMTQAEWARLEALLEAKTGPLWQQLAPRGPVPSVRDLVEQIVNATAQLLARDGAALGELTQADLDAIAAAVADEQARRLGGKA